MQTLGFSDWVALLALAVSLSVLYLEHFRAFNLKVTVAGRISLTKNPLALSDHPLGFREAAVALDLIFENRGSRVGVVRNVALAIRSDGYKGLFVANLEFLDRSIQVTKELAPAQLVPFAGFSLGKGERVPKKVLLRETMGAQSTIPVGSYTGELWVSAAPGEAWEYSQLVAFEVDADDVRELDSMRPVPQPEGGFFLKWVTRDKVTDDFRILVDRLKDEVFPGQSGRDSA